MNFQDFLLRRIDQEAVSTEDALASFLPLAREVIETHRAGFVAPLEGLQNLRVEENRIWYEVAARQPIRNNAENLAKLEQASRASRGDSFRRPAGR